MVLRLTFASQFSVFVFVLFIENQVQIRGAFLENSTKNTQQKNKDKLQWSKILRVQDKIKVTSIGETAEAHRVRRPSSAAAFVLIWAAGERMRFAATMTGAVFIVGISGVCA